MLLKIAAIIVSLTVASGAVAQTNSAINCYLGGIVPNESRHDSVVTFVNNALTEVDILWVNYDGVEEYYNTLQPGGSYSQPTYYGHPWVIYRAGSNICKGIIVPFSPEVRFEVN